jgi:hypothetical protein
MLQSKVGVVMFRSSAIYLVTGLALGLFMAISHNHGLATVHTHITLLGWAAMAVAGLVYTVLPDSGRTKLAVWHVWLHSLGLPVMMAGLAAMVQTGSDAYEPVVALGSMLTVAGLALFATNTWRHTGSH